MTDRYVLVTGGTRRIGFAITCALASSGFQVLAQSRQTAAMAESLPAGATLLVHGNDSAADARAMVLAAQRFARERSGQLVGIVANAAAFEYDVAVSRADGLLDEQLRANLASPLAAWREFLALNEDSPAPCEPTRAFFTIVLDQVVVNPNRDYFSYAVSKGAWLGIVRQLAVNGAPSLRTNAVLPGLVLPGGAMSPERFTQQHANTPLLLGPSAADVASACEFFATNHTLSGQQLLVDAGRHFAPAPRDPAFA